MSKIVDVSSIIFDIFKIICNIFIAVINIIVLVINNKYYTQYDFIGIALTLSACICVLLICCIIINYICFYYFLEKKYVKFIEFVVLILSCGSTAWLSYILYSRINTIWNSDKFLISILILNIAYGYLTFIYMIIKALYEIVKYCNKNNN